MRAVDLPCEQLVERFEALRFPAAEFSHRQHVKLAFAYLLQSELLVAMERFRSALKSFASKHGAHNLYNETITLAFMMLINDRMVATGERDWDRFAANEPDLFAWKPSILERYYELETLRSDRARRSFVWPDKMPTE